MPKVNMPQQACHRTELLALTFMPVLAREVVVLLPNFKYLNEPCVLAAYTQPS